VEIIKVNNKSIQKIMKKVAFHNLGCKVNAYETDIMRKKLSQNGYMIVPFDQRADIYIVNTCSVTNIADRKSRQLLHRARHLNPEAVVVAAGCYVNTRGKERVLPDGVDIAVVNEEKEDIVEILAAFFNESGQEIKEYSGNPYDTGQIRPHTRAFVKCQDGCNRFCSYCIIPYARGRIKSRRISDICNEIDGLAREGFNEIVLTGIHICSYGLDRPGDGEDLKKLILSAAAQDSVRRLRLSSLEPNIITEEFVSEICGLDKLCPHFHLSLQSGSDTVLKRMNRHYTTEEYLKGVELLRKYFNDPAITTDIITGFPGETEEEFHETVEFVKRIRFYETHIFKYSRRRGTVADRMEGQLTEAVKARRSDVLLKINRENKRDYMSRHIDGKEYELLLEEEEMIDGKPYMTGYTKEYIRGAVPLRPGLLSGRAVKGYFKEFADSDTMLFEINEVGNE